MVAPLDEVVGAVQESVDCAFALAVYVNADGAAAGPFGVLVMIEEVPAPAALMAVTRK